MPGSRLHTDHSDSVSRQPGETRARSWWVGISVVSAFILFFVFVAVLAVKWVQVHAPTSVVEIVNIPESLDGDTLQVTGDLLPKPLTYELTPKLRGTQNRVRIYLDSGFYRLSIVRDGTTLFSEPFSVIAKAGVRFDFKRLADTETPLPPGSNRPDDSAAPPL